MDAIARKLPTWKAATMDKATRLVLVQSVLCAMPVHDMMALDVPAEVMASIVKICWGFLWAGRLDAHARHCDVAWDTICSPKWAGGLAIPNFLCWLNFARNARWLWLKCVDWTHP